MSARRSAGTSTRRCARARSARISRPPPRRCRRRREHQPTAGDSWHDDAMRSLRLLSIITVAAALAACGGSKPAPAAPAPTSGPGGTLKELQNGDRACYVVVTTDTGEDQSIEGDFELCPGGARDASALIGRKITWTTTRS